MLSRVSIASCLVFVLLPQQANSQLSPLRELEKNLRQFDRNMCESLGLKDCRKKGRSAGRSTASKAKPAETKPARIAVTRAAQKQAETKPPIPRLKPKSRADEKKALTANSFIATSNSRLKKDQARLGDNKILRDPAPKSQVKDALAAVKVNREAVLLASVTTPKQKPIAPKKELASADCTARLTTFGVSFKIEPQPASTGTCSVDAPVRLIKMRAGESDITFADQPLLNCRFAIELAKWTRDIAAPLTKVATGKALMAIGTGPGFVCRNRNGEASGKMSEHGLGNAIDIERFKLAGDTTLIVKNVAQERSTERPALQALRGSACGTFTTVLGPGSNAAHEEHFHFDLAARQGNYRICQ